MAPKKKKVIGEIKLEIPAGQANPSPPVGPALGQRGLNIMDFCKQFNDRTQDQEKGIPIPVVITAYADKSFDFITKAPPTSFYIKKSVNISKGADIPGRSNIAKVTLDQVEEIAKIKQEEMGVTSLEAAISTVKGTARSMGVEIAE